MVVGPVGRCNRSGPWSILTVFSTWVGVESLRLNSQQRVEERQASVISKKERTFRPRYHNRRYAQSVTRVTTHCTVGLDVSDVTIEEP